MLSGSYGRSRTVIIKPNQLNLEDQSMNVQTRQMNLKDSQQIYLEKACQEEATGNLQEAERFFELALRCDDLLHSETGNAAKNEHNTTPPNGDLILLTNTEIKENDYVQQSKK
jgi:hypothetical protein